MVLGWCTGHPAAARCANFSYTDTVIGMRNQRESEMPTQETETTKSQGTKPLTEMNAWKALGAHFESVGTLHLRDLFAGDASRGERLTV